MRWIPRLLAGTCVVVAAALTAAPVTAGLADLVLNPGPPTTKRSAQPALTSARTAAPETDRAALPAAEQSDRSASGDAVSDDRVFEGTIVKESASHGSELVAASAADAHARVSDLAADLQAGVDAGEITQVDADRVLADISGYIRGDRTWPERLTA